MARFDFDLLTIGAGSGGVSGSRRAGSYGARVGIIEAGRVGGTCVLRGCVPKKLLVYGVEYADHFEDAAGFGWQVGETALDWGRLIETKNRELDRLNGIYLNLLKSSQVALIEGKGVLVDPHTVSVEGRHYTAERIMIATGGWPSLPKIPGIEHAITSNEALDLTRLPRRAVVVGGGYIGVEFAGIFARAGVDVTMVLRNTAVLGGFDEEIRQHLAGLLAARGIGFQPQTQVTRIDKQADGSLLVSLTNGASLATDCILFATGRHPNTAGLGLAEAGVDLTERGAIKVDGWSRTNIASIYAVGDVTDRVALTPVAIAEARALAETLFNDNPMIVSHRNIATAVFSQPPVSTVGLSEQQALACGHPVDLYTAKFRPMRNTLSGREDRTLMKLVVDAQTDKVLGCHMIGPDAPEIIQGLAIAITCGATKKQFDATIGIHPSAAEEFVTMRERRRVLPDRKAE